MDRKRWVIAGSFVGLLAVVAIAAALLSKDTPQDRIHDYLDATAAGDEQRALASWSVFSVQGQTRPGLMARRASLPRTLVADQVGRTYTITSIEWWRTCCEPGPIDRPGNAGLARTHVIATDREGREQRLVFEVFVKDLAWWGDAGGQSTHDWRIYEVHREEEPCTFPSTAFGCTGGPRD